MPQAILLKSTCFEALPAQWPGELLPEIRKKVGESRQKIVVLDDDPTGTQTVHGLPVLTSWSQADLEAELESDFPAFYILTNSRSLTSSAAQSLSREIGTRLRQAARNTGAELELVSRSDSTLRGHFPQEVDALLEAVGSPDLPCVICPFFLEGGRFTIDDIHYVAEGNQLVPAAQTAYARDAVFGYGHSHLGRWVEEKTGGRVGSDRVVSISLADLRRGGPQVTANRLLGLKPGSYCVVNAVSYRDLEVLVAGLLEAESRGARFVFRSAASFVRVRAGILPRQLLTRTELEATGRHGGLFVIGSHVPKTTAQLTKLLAQPGLTGVEMDATRVLPEPTRSATIEELGLELDRLLAQGTDVALFTSRTLIEGNDARSSLEIGRRISDALIAIVRRLHCRPRYLVAKGGITSSDLATQGLGVHRAMVMGQVLPGVPVWKLGAETRYSGMAYIVFPGNVGETDALASIHKLLANRDTAAGTCPRSDRVEN